MDEPVLFDEEMISPVLLGVAAIVGALAFIGATATGHPIPYAILIFIDFVLLVNFFSCRVTVTRSQLRIRYGLAIIQSAYPRHTIEVTKPVENRAFPAVIYRPFSESAISVRIRGQGEIVLPCTAPQALRQSLDVRSEYESTRATKSD